MAVMLFTKFYKHVKNLDNIFIVIPTYNEENRISLVISELCDLGFKNIVAVNDASTDDTRIRIEEFETVTILDHLINLGPGGATQTGIEYSVNQHAEYIVTIDGDNQHDPKDITGLIQKIQDEDLDMVIGSRFLGYNEIPKIRRIYNRIANVFNYMLTGVFVSDSQSGLKIIKGSLAEQLALESNGFEFCMEIIKSAQKKKAKIGEIPITVTYTRDTMNKGQSLSTGISMITRLFSPFS